MRGMDQWVGAVVIGVLSGVGSGGLAAWIGPAAHASAEEKRLLAENQRALIKDAQQLVSEAYQQDWDHEKVALDQRFIAVRKELSESVREMYAIQHNQNIIDGDFWSTRNNHQALQNDLERLAGHWKLS